MNPTIRACVPRPRLPSVRPPSHVGRMAEQTAAAWRPGATLHIAFDASSIRAQRVAVMRAATEWMAHANIHLVQVVSATAEIRCAFDEGEGSWSYVGREAAQIPPNEPTMNMGWLNDPGRDLHELGHSLGLVHEHQWGAIPWNREACYRYYGAAPNNWSRREVDEQVLDRIDPATLTMSAWDHTSIMMYPVPPELVTDPRFSSGWNQVLSPTDIAMIGKLYPR